MAPTSKSTSAKKAKKAAPTKKSHSSSPLKVERPTIVKRAKPLPSDWPVASRPPTLAASDSALRPGSLLQQVCNGQDIHLNKQALVPPSLAKEKGRYLLILPGTLNLKSIQQQVSGDLATNDNLSEPPSQDDNDEDVDNNNNYNDDQEDEEDEEKVSSSQPTANTVKPTTILPQLGKVVGLSTATPKLRIAFPGCGKSLVFPGTKVPTSSKFMWLNCSNRKKGSVACKGIFSSAIVFGAPVWEADGGNNDNKDSSPASPVVEDSTTTTTNENKQDWVHYGGSERTVDGVFKGNKKKKDDESLPVHVPIISKEPIFDERGLPTRPMIGIHHSASLPSSSSNKKAVTLDVSDNDDDDDDDDEEFMASIKLPSSTTTNTLARSAPKRKASVEKKIKYTVDLLDSDVEEEESSSSSEDDIADKKPVASTTKAKAQPKQPRGRTSLSKPIKSTVDLLSEEEDSEVEEKTKLSSSRPTKKAGPIKQNKAKTTPVQKGSTGRKKTAKLEEPSSSEDEVAYDISDDDEVLPRPTSQRRSSTRTPRASSAKKQSYKEADSDDDDGEEDSAESDQDSAVPPAAPKGKPKTMTATKETNSRNSEKQEPIELSDGGQVGSDDEDMVPTIRATTTTKSNAKPSRRQSSSGAPKSYKDDESDSDEVEAQGDSDESDDAGPSSARNKKITPRRSRKKKVPADKASTALSSRGSILEQLGNTTETDKPKTAGEKKRKSMSDSVKAPEKTVHGSGDENHHAAINVEDDPVQVVEKPASKRPKTSLTKPVVVRRNSSNTAASSNKVAVLAGLDSPAPSVKASPFRSRRRKSPGGSASSSAQKPTPAKRNVFDLSKDDADFNF